MLRNDFSLGGKNDLWLPLGLDRAKPQNRGSHYLHVTGRLKPGVGLAQVSADLDRFATQLAREYPDNYGPGSGWGMFVIPLKDQIVSNVRPALLVLLGAVAFVLLIACVNVANLLLAQASAREKELSIRSAMGAGRARIIRQFLTESLVLATAGGALGLFLAYWGVYGLRLLVPENFPRRDEVGVDPLVLCFTLGISLLTGLIFGLAPAWHVGRANLQDALKETGQSTSAAKRHASLARRPGCFGDCAGRAAFGRRGLADSQFPASPGSQSWFSAAASAFDAAFSSGQGLSGRNSA